VRWAGYSAHLGEIRNANKILYAILNGKERVKHIDLWITLKWILSVCGLE
jgi:hypothetical protein